MSGGAEYDDQLDCHEEGTPAQLAARRTRRRRRHGKKQGFPSPDASAASSEAQSEDGRGRWLPPPSSTTLTLAQLGIHLPAKKDNQGLTLTQLGIHVPPPKLPAKGSGQASSRNVVTWSDLDLVDCIGRTAISPGAFDIRRAPPQPAPQHQPPPCMPVAAPTWPCVDERPWERILSVPSPQVALSLAENMQMPHYPVVPPRPQNQHHHIQPAPQSAPSWNAEPDPALRHWLCAGQYGTQPVFNSQLCGGSGQFNSQPVPATPPLQTAPGCTGVAAPPPLNPALGGPGLAMEMPQPAALESDKALESTKLETLLEHLAAEAYQD